MSDLRQRYAEALAAKFTEPIYRSDKWGNNEWVENPEPADRIEQTPRIVFTAGDGHPAFRMPSCTELGEVVAAVRDEELERLRLIAKVNYGLYRSAHEEAEIAAATVARVRRLRDVYEVNARTIDGVAGRNFFELFTEELRATLDPPRDLPPEETTNVRH